MSLHNCSYIELYIYKKKTSNATESILTGTSKEFDFIYKKKKI